MGATRQHITKILACPSLGTHTHTQTHTHRQTHTHTHRHTHTNLNVMSSSPRDPPSVIIAGRTCGGDTGSTVRIIQSGRQKRGSSPRFSQSASDTRFRISSASSAYRSRSPVMVSSGCTSPGAACGYFTLKFSPERRTPGCGAPQPWSGVSSDLSRASCLQIFLPLQMVAISDSLACGCFLRSAVRKRMSEVSAIIMPHLWHTHDSSFCRMESMPQWKTGLTRLMCPKWPGHVMSLPWHVLHR